MGQGSIGRFAPGSELARERKGCESYQSSDFVYIWAGAAYKLVTIAFLRYQQISACRTKQQHFIKLYKQTRRVYCLQLYIETLKRKIRHRIIINDDATEM